MLLSALEHLMAEAAIDLTPVEFEDLGTFIASKHPEYVSEDPVTGEVKMFPPRYSYRCKMNDAIVAI